MIRAPEIAHIIRDAACPDDAANTIAERLEGEREIVNLLANFDARNSILHLREMAREIVNGGGAS